MNRVLGCLLAAVLTLPLVAIAFAQTKELTGEKKTVKASVEAIETSTRSVTLKRPDGTYVTVSVPLSQKRFDTLKIGDVVTATYYENIVLRLKQPGEKDVDSASAAVTPSKGGAGRTTAAQRTITATITAIDQKVPSITFTGPNNWTYSSRVEDKAALAKVKVGDKVDITWTEAMLVSLDAPGK